MKISVIGAGAIGGNLARMLSAAGHDVLVADARGPEAVTSEVVAAGARAVELDAATVDREVVVLSIPFSRQPGLALREPSRGAVAQRGRRDQPRRHRPRRHALIAARRVGRGSRPPPARFRGHDEGPRSATWGLARGRYWDRTSDLFRVREARYRCANRPGTYYEVEMGFEPTYTALQAAASPLGHSTLRPQSSATDEGRPGVSASERTTGFEPATLTLAR
jgi:choline dehydrogenase-like flavoprotein